MNHPPRQPDDDSFGIYRVAPDPAWPAPVPAAKRADDKPAIPYALPVDETDGLPLAIPVDDDAPVAHPAPPLRKRRLRRALDAAPFVPGPNFAFALIWWVGFFVADL